MWDQVHSACREHYVSWLLRRIVEGWHNGISVTLFVKAKRGKSMSAITELLVFFRVIYLSLFELKLNVCPLLSSPFLPLPLVSQSTKGSDIPDSNHPFQSSHTLSNQHP
jgi:hypothetical protein